MYMYEPYKLHACTHVYTYVDYMHCCISFSANIDWGLPAHTASTAGAVHLSRQSGPQLRTQTWTAAISSHWEWVMWYLQHTVPLPRNSTLHCTLCIDCIQMYRDLYAFVFYGLPTSSPEHIKWRHCSPLWGVVGSHCQGYHGDLCYQYTPYTISHGNSRSSAGYWYRWMGRCHCSALVD